nr:CIH_HP1_G0018300.mRNA.1.CDS.1 [Saccharomyces cerevisiae]
MGSFNNEDEDLSISNFNSENADSNDIRQRQVMAPQKGNGNTIEVKIQTQFYSFQQVKSFNK